MDRHVPEFTVRDPRYSVKIPVFFRFGKDRAKGHSVNISETGILVAFAESMDIWITGRLTLILDEWPLDISARILRVDGHLAAMVFVDHTREDRLAIRTFVEQSHAPLVPERAAFEARHPLAR